MPAAASVTREIAPAERVRGAIRVPGDKSISHRYAILAALADGRSRLTGYAPGADCQSTLTCLAGLGVDIERPAPDVVVIAGRGVRGLSAPPRPLDAGNSGSTLRMLAGVVAAHSFSTTFTGDPSLSRRPMRRIAVPLERLGARVETTDGHAPVTIHGTLLEGIEFTPEVPSAQVKSAVLLAGLQATGTTTVVEPAATRDHTERALDAFGARVHQDGPRISLAGGQRLAARDLQVPGDLSSAAFWAVAAAARPGSAIEIASVGLNQTRTALLAILARAGAIIEIDASSVAAGEPIGHVRVRHNGLNPVVLGPADVPGLIDEIPALAALATFGGYFEVRGAGELRTKESDRISALVAGLIALGGRATELPDGLVVDGSAPLGGGTADACGDHRLAMAFAIAALGARQPSRVVGAEAVDVSYPGFFDVLESVCE